MISSNLRIWKSGRRVAKVRKGDFFTDEEESKWFRRLAILEGMKEEDFVPSGKYADLYTTYMSVSSTLRHMRRLKEVDEQSSDPVVEDGDDVMRIGYSPVREVGSFLLGEGSVNASLILILPSHEVR